MPLASFCREFDGSRSSSLFGLAVSFCPDEALGAVFSLLFVPFEELARNLVNASSEARIYFRRITGPTTYWLDLTLCLMILWSLRQKITENYEVVWIQHSLSKYLIWHSNSFKGDKSHHGAAGTCCLIGIFFFSKFSITNINTIVAATKRLYSYFTFY